MHRVLLEEFLKTSSGDSGQLDSLLRSLVPAVNTFAEWRWKTLAIVTKDLERVRDAVVLATASLQSTSELASGADGQAGVFLAECQTSCVGAGAPPYGNCRRRSKSFPRGRVDANAMSKLVAQGPSSVHGLAVGRRNCAVGWSRACRNCRRYAGRWSARKEGWRLLTPRRWPALNSRCSGYTTIRTWSGRRAPMCVGNHMCLLCWHPMWGRLGRHMRVLS